MNPSAPLTFADIETAARRLQGKVRRTPLLESHRLNAWLGGHRLLFKCENFQAVGAFKARGALNSLLAQIEAGRRPERVVSYSSGNHAQAVAWAAQSLDIPARIYMPEGVSPLKHQATQAYGAEVVLTARRIDSHRRAEEDAADGAFLLPPFDWDDVICGQGTAALEALEDGAAPDAIFAPCGGGGLLSGIWLAASKLAPKAKVFGVEPLCGNDAARSRRDGKLFVFDDAPKSLADGVNTLSLSERTFSYVRHTDGVFEIEEVEIAYWTQWLTHLLKITIEPTSALGLAGAAKWLHEQDTPRNVLIVLSGGNLSVETRAVVWKRNWLNVLPSAQGSAGREVSVD